MGDLDFFNQLPSGLLLSVCIPFFLLAGYAAFAFYIRPARRRKKAEAAKAVETASPVRPSADSSGSSALERLRQARAEAELHGDELPALEMLVPAVAEAPRQLAKSGTTVRLNQGKTARAKELLVVLRDESDGRLLVQLGDTAYRSLADVPEIKRQFAALMKELSTVILKADDTPLIEEKPAPIAPIMEAPPPSIGEMARSTPPTEEKPVPTPKRTTPPPTGGAMPGDLPSYRIEDNPLRIQSTGLGRKKFEADAPPQVDIASAIEAYLQYKIAHTPEFQGRNIHIMPSLSGGVRIRVDDDYYDFVDEIRDAEARVFIQESIAEWQSRQ